MKIDSSFKPTTTGVSPKPPQPQPAPAAVANEAVSLSPLSGSLRAGESMPMNTARVQEIKQAISEGRFKINPDAIADRLIESARELVNSSRREA